MSLVVSVWASATVTCSLPVILWLALCLSTPWLSCFSLIALIKRGTLMYWAFWDRLRTLKAKPPCVHCRFVCSVPLVLTVWTCLTMQQSMKPLWVRAGSLSQVPNLEGISEFQLPLEMMCSKHANMALICSVLELCLPQLSWELGVCAQFGVLGICGSLWIEN